MSDYQNMTNSEAMREDGHGRPERPDDLCSEMFKALSQVTGADSFYAGEGYNEAYFGDNLDIMVMQHDYESASNICGYHPMHIKEIMLEWLVEGKV